MDNTLYIHKWKGPQSETYNALHITHDLDLDNLPNWIKRFVDSGVVKLRKGNLWKLEIPTVYGEVENEGYPETQTVRLGDWLVLPTTISRTITVWSDAEFKRCFDEVF
jgi:hypothetical protein